MPDQEQSAREDQPAPSVELDALRLLVEAYIAAEGPKKGQRLLAAAARILAMRDSAAPSVVQFLPPKEREARERVRKQTKAWFRSVLPAWIERLDQE